MVWSLIAEIASGTLSRVGELLGVASLLHDRRAEKSRVKGEIVKAHRQLWSELRELVDVDQLCDRQRDMALRPRTEQETHAVRLLLVHFGRALTENHAGHYDLPEKLSEDVRDFFSRPAPADAWRHLKTFHDAKVAAFIDQALAGER